ncbi:MFS transporter [Nocardioides sp. NPDC059952]|uniref:MFS transporter n=1 Tax=Nocardioides sp. NPDC059952 TaxID=3347014 RepID=UPI0036531704
MTEPTASVRRWAVPFFAHTVLIQAVTFVLRPTAVYRALELDVPSYWMGALGATFAIVPLVLAVPAGLLSDRYGERPVMVTGGLITIGSATAFLYLGHSVAGVIAATVLLGIGHLLSVVAQQAMVANRTPRARYDSAFGHYTFAASAGQAIGPGLIILFGGSQAIPHTGAIFTASLALSVALLLAAIATPSTHDRRGDRGPVEGSIRDLVRRKGLLRALTVSCVVLAAVDISLVYLPLLGTERDIASGTIGLLLALRAGSSMISRLMLGRLTERLGRPLVLTGSVTLAALAMALAPIPMPVVLLGFVVVVMGLSLGAGQPLTMSWLAEATPPGLRGRAMSLRLTGNRLGQVVVPSLAGLVAVGAGASGVLWVTAAALGVVAAASRSIPRSDPNP